MSKNIEQVKSDLAKLKDAGLIDDFRMENGQIGWKMNPSQMDFALDILRHPERWDDIPMFRSRKSQLTALREQAIRNGRIQP